MNAEVDQDPQKARVYRWEGSFRYSDERSLTRAETLRVIRRCCRIYKVKSPRIRFLPRDAREWSYYNIKDDLLVMNFQQCNHWIACHEAAHVIVFRKWGEGLQDHGPEFLAIYMRLLREHHVAPREALEASARGLHLKWTR